MSPATVATVRRGVWAIVDANFGGRVRTRYQTGDRHALLVLHLFSVSLGRWAATPHSRTVWS